VRRACAPLPIAAVAARRRADAEKPQRPVADAQGGRARGLRGAGDLCPRAALPRRRCRHVLRRSRGWELQIGKGPEQQPGAGVAAQRRLTRRGLRRRRGGLLAGARRVAQIERSGRRLPSVLGHGMDWTFRDDALRQFGQRGGGHRRGRRFGGLRQGDRRRGGLRHAGLRRGGFDWWRGHDHIAGGVTSSWGQGDDRPLYRAARRRRKTLQQRHGRDGRADCETTHYPRFAHAPTYHRRYQAPTGAVREHPPRLSPSGCLAAVPPSAARGTRLSPPGRSSAAPRRAGSPGRSRSGCPRRRWRCSRSPGRSDNAATLC
jgi:hypothetical protein